MDFLTQFQKLEPKEIYNLDDIKILDINGTKSIQENDKIIILPYYVQKRGILLRYENLPTFEVRQKGISHYLTALTADLINDDKLNTVKDALLKKFGIRSFLDDKITITNPVFLTKSQSTKYYFAFVNLFDNQYEEIETNEFEKLEMKDKNAFISLDDLSNCVIYDLVTQYALDYFEKEFLLF